MYAVRGASGLTFKRLLIAFWTMFFSMVALTNFVDLMGEFSVFHWTFLNSGNFDYMREVVKVYDIGKDLTKVLLTGAFLIELVGAILFWRALLGFGRLPVGRRRAFEALCWGTFVWIAFVFMTEFFVAYSGESVFRELLVIMIATGLAIELIPDESGLEPGEPT